MHPSNRHVTVQNEKRIRDAEGLGGDDAFGSPGARDASLIRASIEKFSAALDSRIAVHATSSERAEQATWAMLASGVRAQSESVGRRLGMSSRTLQRRLAEEGTNFRVGDAVLWEAVEVLLPNPSLKIEAIALSVGFSEAAAFSKAYRQWKGYPPTRFRENMLARSKGAVSPAAGRRRARCSHKSKP